LLSDRQRVVFKPVRRKRQAVIIHSAGFYKTPIWRSVDANSKNISEAMSLLDGMGESSNTYELKLSDIRNGFGGIPYEDETFDVMSMVGGSEFGHEHRRSTPFHERGLEGAQTQPRIIFN